LAAVGRRCRAEPIMSSDAAFYRSLRHDRVVTIAALAGVILLAWGYVLLGAGIGREMAMSDMAMPMPWTLGTFGVMLLMWTVMMAAMMLPSAAPVILLLASISRRRTAQAAPYPATGLFAVAYLVIWAAFSIVATSAQWALQQENLLSPAMASSSASLVGTLFVFAGVYQLTPLKQACLRRCRSPLDFVTDYWRPGPFGAFRMGFRHGLFCLGCCWAMMTLLFAGGLMNVLWIAALALFVLVEKTTPSGGLFGRVAGIGLILLGGATLLPLIG
jgi:predicted metal-binding membrane protein